MPRIPLSVFFIFFSINSAFSQNGFHSLQHYTHENSLLPNSATVIAPDKSGFVRLSVRDGLIRCGERELDDFGTGNFTAKLIPLYIIPARYRKDWFYLTCILVVIVGMWRFARLRIKYIEKQNRQLEELISVKKKELQWRTNIRGKIIRSISHDIQIPLQYHKIISEKIYTSLLSGEKSSALTFAKTLNDSAYQLHYLIENLLTYLKFQTMAKAPDKETIDLYKLIEEKRAIFSAIADEKRSIIYNNIPPETGVNGNRQLLAVIIHNLLDNAVKITEEGMITINAKRFEDMLWIIIEDTGPGISKFLQDWINSPLQKNERTVIPKEYLEKNGIGLLMVKELSIVAGIRLQVTAERGKGTRFTIIC